MEKTLIRNAENVLKTFYLGKSAEYLNVCTHPFLSRVEQTSNDVWGKEIRKLATKSLRNDDYVDGYAQLCAELENLCVEIELDEKEIKLAHNAVAFTNLLDATFDEKAHKSRKEIGERVIGKIGEVFADTSTLYGLNRQEYDFLNSYKVTSETISDEVIDGVLDKLSFNTDFILCSFGVKRKYLEYCEKIGKNVDVLMLENGFKAISYGGIPMVADRNVPNGTMWLLNTDCFKLHQLCDWRWLESEDYTLIREVNGKYSVYLVKYANLMCSLPSAQAQISGIKEY